MFEPAATVWSGLGRLAGSGLAIRERYRRFDAGATFGEARPVAGDPAGCCCGEVVAGLRKPFDCPAFGARCTPERPLGAPMASAEGVCAAYHRNRRADEIALTRGHLSILPAPAAPGGA